MTRGVSLSRQSQVDPVALIERQTEAYNARDLNRFVATYADSVQIFRMPAPAPAISGKSQLTEEYRVRFQSPQLHADILSRIVLGNKVFDHERVSGILADPIEAVAVYEVLDGLIHTVWFYFPGQGSPLPPRG